MTIFRLLLKKYLAESWLLLLSCSVMLLIFPWVRIWTISQFDLSGFEPFLAQLKLFEKFSPVPLEQFLTYPGVVGLNFDEPILILCTLVWSISRGSDLASGEIGRGTMEMLLAQPVSRITVVAAHGLVSVIGLIMLVSMHHLGTYLGIETNTVTVVQPAPTITVPLTGISIPIPWAPVVTSQEPLSNLAPIELFLAPTINLFSLGFFVLGLSIFFSSMDQYRWRTIGLTIGTYIVQLVMFILAKSTPKLAFIKYFTLLAAYQPDWMIQQRVREPSTAWDFWLSGTWTLSTLGYISVLMTAGIVLYVAGSIIFCRRDIPAPL